MLDQRPTDKVVIVDFDGTLCKFAFPDIGPIEPDVQLALSILRTKGYKIKIHSCRTATYWNNEKERKVHISLMRQFLSENKIPYDEIILSRSMDKPVADVYIDDRAIKYDGNWLQIVEAIK